MERTDADHVLAAVGGDPEAFGRLAQRLAPPLIGYVTGLLGDRDDAEEVAQDALLAAWRDLHRLRNPAQVGNWIFRIARNLAFKRRRRPRPATLQPATLPEDVPAAPCGDAESRHDRDLALLAAIARLREPFREVIMRKHFSGASAEQVAVQLGIAPGTVRSRLARAYAALRRMLADQEDGCRR